jgi:uncharacterized membrane protein YhiD involved in acid resistance
MEIAIASALIVLVILSFFAMRLDSIVGHTKRSADALEEIDKREVARELERIRAELAKNKKTET